MSVLDPAKDSPASLDGLRAALAAALAALPALQQTGEEDEDADIATPRAKAAAALELALKARRDWHHRRGESAGVTLCKVLIDMCAWHEHPHLRSKVLLLQEQGIDLLASAPDGQPSMGDVGEIEDTYQTIKPRDDDAAAIAAALGMSLEEARAFGLVGTLDHVGFDDEAPARTADLAAKMAPEPEEDLETLFRREALMLATKTLPQALQRFWGDQRSIDAMLSVRRGFHTLKGDARVTAQSVSGETADELEGLAVLSEAAEDIVDYLLGDDYDSSQPAPSLPPGAFSLLNETATALARRLEARTVLDNEAALLRRLQAMQRKAAVAAGSEIDDATLAAKIPLPRTRPATAAPRAASPRPAPGHSLLPTFLEEADRLMPDLHRALAILSESPSDENALVRARVKLHTLKGGAALIGDEALEVQQIAHSAEDLLELIEDFQLRGEMSGVPKEVLDGVLDAEDALQALLDTLRRQLQGGRAATSRLPLVPPQQLVRTLDDIAARVRRGDVGKDAAPAPDPKAASPDPAAVAAAAATPRPFPTRRMDLRSVTMRDLVAQADHVQERDASGVQNWLGVVEDRAWSLDESFSLFICLGALSGYEQDRARYSELLGEHGHLYVFGVPDVASVPAPRVTLVPLDQGDALFIERAAILDVASTPMAFLAAPDPSAAGDQPLYASVYIEDENTVYEAAGRLRTVLQEDATLLALRRTSMPQEPFGEAAPRPVLDLDRVRRPAPEYGKEHSVKVALGALEDISVNRDALQELVSRMLRQSVESRRSSRRLRTLVERVGTELAGLRSELVRTTRRTGDWDLLEKEEYTTVDVLLMQLDEALADLEESDNNLHRDLGEARAQVETQADSQLRAQRSLLNMSMIPLSQLEDRLNHAVRSASRRLGKHVAFKMEGGDLLLDGRIAESLFEPLMHLINNALDHGIEEKAADRTAAGKPVEGRLLIRGRASGDGVAIEVIDDGRGIDPERIAAVAVSRGLVSAPEAAAMSVAERTALIWRAGFSTARNVSTLSGRGMGMKSVLDDVGGLQGRVDVHSAVGAGTTFTIFLPRSLAMLRVEIVREGRDLLAVPITQVVASYPVPYSAVDRAGTAITLTLGGHALEVYGAHLANGPAGDGEAGHGLLLEVAGRAGGILVDEVVGSQYLPVRPAPDYLRRHCGVLGYAVGGAGRILPILDLPTLIDRASNRQPQVGTEQAARPAYTVLVVDDSQTMRRALKDTLSKAGFQVGEAADGRDALATCTRAMPDLITLDMEMPGMDGLEALSALRLLPNGGATVPVFMITSRQQARHRAAALAAGVTRYFTKPYDTDELIGAAQLALAEGVQHPREAAS